MRLNNFQLNLAMMFVGSIVRTKSAIVSSAHFCFESRLFSHHFSLLFLLAVCLLLIIPSKFTHSFLQILQMDVVRSVPHFFSFDWTVHFGFKVFVSFQLVFLRFIRFVLCPLHSVCTCVSVESRLDAKIECVPVCFWHSI